MSRVKSGKGMSTKQFDYAKDAVRQVIALSSGILALSLTFFKDWSIHATSGQKWLLRSSWISFNLAILLGLLCMLFMTGMIGTGDSIWASRLRWPWILQIGTFLAGLIFLSVFGWKVI